MGYMCTSAHYLNNIPLVVFTDTLCFIRKKNQQTVKHIYFLAMLKAKAKKNKRAFPFPQVSTIIQ